MIAFFFLNPQSKKRLQKITEPARVIMCDNIRGPLLLFTKKKQSPGKFADYDMR